MSFRSVPINWYTIYSTSKLDFLYSIAWLRWLVRQTGRFFLATGTLVFLKDIEFLRAEYPILKTLKMTIILINLSRSNDCYPSSAGKGSTKVHRQSRFPRYWFLILPQSFHFCWKILAVEWKIGAVKVKWIHSPKFTMLVCIFWFLMFIMT